MAEHERSYTSGTSELPLLGLTIGDLFDQTAARYPDNEALVCRQQGLRYSYRELKGEVDRCARALMALGIEKGQRVGMWAPNRAEWTHHAVRHEQDRRDPRQYQPELSAERGAVRAPPVRLHVARHRAGVQDVRLYRHDSRAGAGARREPPGQLEAEGLPDLRGVIRLGEARSPGHARLGRAPGEGGGGQRRGPGAAPARAGVRRRDQYPVHERHHRLPEGRHAQPSQYSERRVLHDGASRLHGPRPAPHPRAALSLLRHGHGQSRLRDATGPP